MAFGRKTLDYDDYVDEIGDIGKYQVVVILATGLLTFGYAFASHSSSILSAIPHYR